VPLPGSRVMVTGVAHGTPGPYARATWRGTRPNCCAPRRTGWWNGCSARRRPRPLWRRPCGQTRRSASPSGTRPSAPCCSGPREGPKTNRTATDSRPRPLRPTGNPSPWGGQPCHQAGGNSATEFELSGGQSFRKGDKDRALAIGLFRIGGTRADVSRAMRPSPFRSLVGLPINDHCELVSGPVAAFADTGPVVGALNDVGIGRPTQSSGVKTSPPAVSPAQA
jgi:hypothetical protein